MASAVAKVRCRDCDCDVWAIGGNLGGHAERCPGPRPIRLRQPTYEPWDWAGLMADQDADDRRVTPYLSDDMGDDRPPSDRRH